MSSPEKLNLSSSDVAAEKRSQIAKMFPEAFSEGRIDFDQLKRALGEWIEPGKERFGLSWPGKAECMKVVQQASIATLKPDRQRSLNFDHAKNLFVEGDNLEVLKLLQKAYFGRIKMIYIDPPYNTGGEFIYPDKYSESLETYLAYTTQTDEHGNRFSTNTDMSGRYHSRWLNMMFPRLYLARNLLREDGVIFISIDDHEVSRLRELCDQIFGEENFVASVIWQKVYAPKSSARHFSEDHDYILVYARNSEVWIPEMLPRTEAQDRLYKNPDNDPRGDWRPNNLAARNYYSKGLYSIQCPGGRFIEGPPKGSYWRISEDKFWELDRDGRIWWGEDKNNIPAPKIYRTEVKQGRVPQTLWFYKDVGHTQEAKKELLEYVSFEQTENVLNSVKPTRLIRQMLQIATSADDDDCIVLDFFGGSASTAHAVLLQNQEDHGKRTFIHVQIPEPLNVEEKDLKTIFDLGRSRVENFIKQSEAGQLALKATEERGIGFKVFALDRSNFKTWSGDATRELSQQIELHINHVAENSDREAILFELLLKAGFSLSTPVSLVEIGGKKVFSVQGGDLLICLEQEISPELIDEMAEMNPSQVICLDEAFRQNDQLKANAVQTFRSRSESKESEIVFRTV